MLERIYKPSRRALELTREVFADIASRFVKDEITFISQPDGITIDKREHSLGEVSESLYAIGEISDEWFISRLTSDPAISIKISETNKSIELDAAYFEV
jgi:hypothetical protein